jgi:hypothetical protein
LESKDRDATGSQDENGLAGLQFPFAYKSSPSGDRSAGQSGGLSETPGVGYSHEGVFVENSVISEHSVEISPEVVLVVRHGERAGGPGRKEACSDAIGGFPLLDFGAHSKNFPGAIGERDAIIDISARKVPPSDKIAIVKGSVMDADQAVLRSEGFWVGRGRGFEAKVVIGGVFTKDPASVGTHRKKSSSLASKLACESQRLRYAFGLPSAIGG